MCGSLRVLAAIPPLACELTTEGEQEGRVVIEIAREEATGLLRDAVAPLQAPSLYPRRRLRDPPAMEVKGRAHPGHHRDVEVPLHPRHPLLLLRGADPDPQHVRTIVLDLANEAVLLRPGERPERRRVAADDPN